MLATKSTVQRVAKNTGIIIAGDVIFKLISLFVTIYLARYLGTVGFGKYSFIFAYLAFFNILTDLGLQQILVREMARNPAITPKLIGNGYIIRWILTVLAVVSSVVIITVMSYPADTTTYIYIAAFTLIFISFSDFYRTIFEANLRMKYNVFARMVFKFLSAGLILWIIFSHGTLLQVIIALVFSEMVKTLLSYAFSRKFVRPRFEIDFGLWKYLLKEALPLALSSVMWVIYYQTDKIMLSMMQGDAPVGIYSAAYKLCEPFSLIPAALIISLFPLMSAYFKSSKDRLIKSYRLSFKYILIIMLPIAIGTTLLADKIILLIYGTEFAGSITVLQILIWTMVLVSVNYILSNLLVSIDKQRVYTISTGLCVITNVTLNFLLIPTLSYNGAAIATVATNVVLFAACFYFVSKHLLILPVHKILVKPVIAGLTMGIFVYYFIELNMFLLVPLSGIVYLAALVVLKTFTIEDKEMIRKIVIRR
jgi:O-antigen/teichoic acid export membrane protein